MKINVEKQFHAVHTFKPRITNFQASRTTALLSTMENVGVFDRLHNYQAKPKVYRKPVVSSSTKAEVDEFCTFSPKKAAECPFISPRREKELGLPVVRVTPPSGSSTPVHREQRNKKKVPQEGIYIDGDGVACHVDVNSVPDSVELYYYDSFHPPSFSFTKASAAQRHQVLDEPSSQPLVPVAHVESTSIPSPPPLPAWVNEKAEVPKATVEKPFQRAVKAAPDPAKVELYLPVVSEQAGSYPSSPPPAGEEEIRSGYGRSHGRVEEENR